MPPFGPLSPVEMLAQADQRRADGGSMLPDGLRRLSVGYHRRPAAAEHAGFLTTDRLAGVSQPAAVIDADVDD